MDTTDQLADLGAPSAATRRNSNVGVPALAGPGWSLARWSSAFRRSRLSDWFFLSDPGSFNPDRLIGTTEAPCVIACFFGRPYGTLDVDRTRIPAMNRWAILSAPRPGRRCYHLPPRAQAHNAANLPPVVSLGTRSDLNIGYWLLVIGYSPLSLLATSRDLTPTRARARASCSKTQNRARARARGTSTTGGGRQVASGVPVSSMKPQSTPRPPMESGLAASPTQGRATPPLGPQSDLNIGYWLLVILRISTRNRPASLSRRESRVASLESRGG